MLKEKSEFGHGLHHELRELSHIMKRTFHALLEQFKDEDEGKHDRFTHTHGFIIGYLARSEGDVYQKDIESFLSISKPAVTEVLKRMEAKGLLERVPVESDARLKKLVLTEKAWAMHEQIHKQFKDMEAKMEAGISEEEKAVFIKIIQKIKKNLTEVTNLAETD